MPLNCKNPDDVLKAIKDNDVRMVDVRFADLPATWKHSSLPPHCSASRGRMREVSPGTLRRLESSGATPLMLPEGCWAYHSTMSVPGFYSPILSHSTPNGYWLCCQRPTRAYLFWEAWHPARPTLGELTSSSTGRFTRTAPLPWQLEAR